MDFVFAVLRPILDFGAEDVFDARYRNGALAGNELLLPAGNYMFKVKVWNMFKVNNKDNDVVLISLLLALNIFHTCF